MISRADPSVAVRALRSAAPYIRMYKGKVFIIKASGGVFGEPELTRGLMEQVAILPRQQFSRGLRPREYRRARKWNSLLTVNTSLKSSQIRTW